MGLVAPTPSDPVTFPCFLFLCFFFFSYLALHSYKICLKTSILENLVVTLD